MKKFNENKMSNIIPKRPKNIQHTPGPWLLYDRHYIGLQTDNRGNGLCRSTGDDIEEVNIRILDGPTRSEHVGNCLLVEAAPELLDLLKEARTILMDNTDVAGAVGLDSWLVEVRYMIDHRLAGKDLQEYDDEE